MQNDILSGLHAARNEAASIEINEDYLIVTTRDGRIIHTPLWWFRFLEGATPEQRCNFENEGSSIWWPDLDDGIAMEVILIGRYNT